MFKIQTQKANGQWETSSTAELADAYAKTHDRNAHDAGAIRIVLVADSVPHTVDSLKAAGDYFAAGALAFQLGHPQNYGCHFGMRSTYQHACDEFYRGWNSAAFPKG